MHVNLTNKMIFEQECIPVGCVPAARKPYAAVCFPGGDVCSREGVPGPGGGVCFGGVSAPGGVCSGGCLVCSGGCLVWGGSAWSGGGGWYPSMHMRQTPLPPVDRQMPVKILPWSNFVAAGNNSPHLSNRSQFGLWLSGHFLGKPRLNPLLFIAW